jgi:hypothetical protein
VGGGLCGEIDWFRFPQTEFLGEGRRWGAMEIKISVVLFAFGTPLLDMEVLDCFS